MNAAEIESFVEHRLGAMHGSVRAELETLKARLRPEERLVAIAVAIRSVLIGGACLIAATDQRLLLVWSGSECEEIAYDAIVSVTDHLAAHQLAIVTGDRVHALTVPPTPGAGELVEALASRIGQDRVHARAGAAEARLAQKALAGFFATACLVFVCFFGRTVLDRVIDGREASERAHTRLEQGACVGLNGRAHECDASVIAVVLGPRDMPRCPASSATLVRGLTTTADARRELARWCIGLHTPDP